MRRLTIAGSFVDLSDDSRASACITFSLGSRCCNSKVRADAISASDNGSFESRIFCCASCFARMASVTLLLVPSMSGSFFSPGSPADVAAFPGSCFYILQTYLGYIPVSNGLRASEFGHSPYPGVYNRIGEWRGKPPKAPARSKLKTSPNFLVWWYDRDGEHSTHQHAR